MVSTGLAFVVGVASYIRIVIAIAMRSFFSLNEAPDVFSWIC